MHSWSLFLVLVCCFWISVLGVYKNYDKTTNGLFAEYLIEQFGMARGGHITVDYNLQSNCTLDAYNSYVVILVISDKERNGWYPQLDGSVNPSDVPSLCNKPSSFRNQIYGDGSFEIEIPDDAESTRYSVAIMQCRYPYKNRAIDIHVRATMTNPRPYSDEESHLPIQDVFISRVLLGEIIIYSLFFGGILVQFYYAYQWVRGIHVVFAASVLMQLMALSAQYYDYRHFNETGDESRSTIYAYNLTSHLSSVVVLTALLLLSLGWSLVRSTLSAKEMRLIISIMSFYLLIGLGSSVCIENTRSCQYLYLVTYVVRTLVFLGIIIAMNFTVTQLKAGLVQSPWTQSVPLQYLRTRQYQLFRIAFIIYLLMPTAILLVQTAILSWQEEWLPFTMNELLILFMFFHVGVTFSPLHENTVTRAFDGTYNAIHLD